MIRRPPRSTRTDTLFPYTTLFRSASFRGCPVPCLLLPSNRLSGDGHAIGRNTDAPERRRERGAAGIDGVVRAQGAQRVSHDKSNPVAGESGPEPPYPHQTVSKQTHADTRPDKQPVGDECVSTV